MFGAASTSILQSTKRMLQIPFILLRTSSRSSFFPAQHHKIVLSAFPGYLAEKFNP